MKKIFLTSATVFGFVGFIANANANISANAESAGCNNDTIGATSGTTTLEAQWQANTITLNWYDGDTKLDPLNSGAASCTYDSGITLPGNSISKNGYTFDGWRVKVATNPFLSWDMSPLNFDFYSDQLHITSTCSAKSAWTFIYASNPSDWLATDEEIEAAGAGKNCWCKVTGYGSQTAQLSWTYSGFTTCSRCQENCYDNLRYNNDQLIHGARVAMFLQENQFVANCSTVTDRNTCYKSYSGSSSWCAWSNTDSACYDPLVSSSGCGSIKDEERCRMSFEEYSFVHCTWNDYSETCDVYAM